MDCEKCIKIVYSLERHIAVVEFCPLHAAAPELLKAAKEALDVLNALEYYDEAREMLRKAIAKAEGGNHE